MALVTSLPRNRHFDVCATTLQKLINHHSSHSGSSSQSPELCEHLWALKLDSITSNHIKIIIIKPYASRCQVYAMDLPLRSRKIWRPPLLRRVGIGLAPLGAGCGDGFEALHQDHHLAPPHALSVAAHCLEEGLVKNRHQQKWRCTIMGKLRYKTVSFSSNFCAYVDLEMMWLESKPKTNCQEFWTCLTLVTNRHSPCIYRCCFRLVTLECVFWVCLQQPMGNHEKQWHFAWWKRAYHQ